MEDIKRREQIRVYAKAYVEALKLTGEDAQEMEEKIQQGFLSGTPIPDIEITDEAATRQADAYLRTEMGWTQDEVEKIKRDLFG